MALFERGITVCTKRSQGSTIRATPERNILLRPWRKCVKRNLGNLVARRRKRRLGKHFKGAYWGLILLNEEQRSPQQKRGNQQPQQCKSLLKQCEEYLLVAFLGTKGRSFHLSLKTTNAVLGKHHVGIRYLRKHGHESLLHAKENLLQKRIVPNSQRPQSSAGHAMIPRPFAPRLRSASAIFWSRLVLCRSIESRVTTLPMHKAMLSARLSSRCMAVTGMLMDVA